MRKLFSILAATLFATTMFAAVQEFTVTISTANFNKTSYAANNNEKTSTAVSKSDPSVTMDVKWTSNQMMLKSDESSVQCQKTNGTIYNSAAWGTVKNIVINDGTNVSYTIGATEKPTTTATGGFFQIKTSSSGTGYFSSIVITFEADPAAASLHADNIELGDMLVEPNEAFEKVVTINVEASNLSAPIAFSTESSMLTFVTTGTLPATGGELQVKINANHGDVLNETVLLSSGELSATVTISGEVWEKYYTPGEVDVKFEAGERAQGGDSTFVNGQKAVKVGTSSAEGTAIITIPAGATKLYFLAAAWSGKPCTLTLSASGIDFSPTTADLKADAGIANNSPFFTKSGNLEQYLVELELNNVGADTEMTLTAKSSNKRFVIWDVTCDKGDTPTPPTPTTFDFVKNEYVEYTADSYFDLIMYTSDTWSYDPDNGFSVGEAGYALVLDLAYTDMADVTGSYTSEDVSFDPEYSGLYYWDGTSEKLVTTKLQSGTVKIEWNTDKSGYVVTYEVLDANNVTYKGTANITPYDEPEPPTPETTVTLNITNGALADYIESDGAIGIQGENADGLGVQLVVYTNQIVGDYTEEDLDANYSVVYWEGDNTSIYSATIKVVPADGGIENGYLVTAELLCYNNTLYKVTLAAPTVVTGINNVNATKSAVKAIENGHLFINVNGVRYNVNGARVK